MHGQITTEHEVKRSGKTGMIVGLTCLGIASIVLLFSFGLRHIGFLWVGALLGFSFYRSGYGFTRAWRQLITRQSTVGSRAHLLWLGIGSLLMFPIFKGALGLSAADIMRPVSVMLVAGAFIFAIGMQIAGSCTSGSMYRAGSGQVRLWFSLVGIVIGAFFAAQQYGFWAGLPQFLIYSYLREFPLLIALAIQLGILAALWALFVALERRWKRGKATTLLGVRSDRVSLAQVRRDGWVSASEGGLLYGRWSLAFGSIVLGVLSLFALLLLGRPWVISLAFPFWGAKIAAGLGLQYDFEFWDYWGIPNNEVMLHRGIFEDPTSLMNMAFIFGATWAAISMLRFKDDKTGAVERAGFTIEWLYRPLMTLLGGVLMGYGAVVGLGCNIGGYMAAVLSGSVHGWFWAFAALVGTVVGVRLRALLKL